jgi:hypothetical protein
MNIFSFLQFSLVSRQRSGHRGPALLPKQRDQSRRN